MENGNGNKWHAKPANRLEMASVVAITVFIAGAAGRFYTDTNAKEVEEAKAAAVRVETILNARVGELQAATTENRVVLARYEADMKRTREDIGDIRQGQHDINEKLDRLLERQLRPSHSPRPYHYPDTGYPSSPTPRRRTHDQ